MAAKSEPGIYLGHDRDHNAPAVLLLRTGKKVISKDVRFVNDRFTHMRAFNGSQEDVDAVLDGEMEPMPSEQRPDDTPDAIQAQGESEQPSDSGDESDSADEATLAESDADEEQEYKIDKIVDRKLSRGGVPTYRVRWEGYGAEEDTWESEETVGDCAALDDYERDHPQPAPRRSPRLATESDHQPDPTGSALERDDSGATSRVEMAM
jgi:hypothetical protein